MVLNIKNQRVHDLARRAAEVTGKTQTGAIEEALERLLAEHDADPRTARIDRVVQAVQLVVAEQRADDADPTNSEITSAEDLYDAATGMPR